MDNWLATFNENNYRLQVFDTHVGLSNCFFNEFDINLMGRNRLYEI